MDNGWLHDAWVLFAGLFSYGFKQLKAKLDDLDKGKADAHQINEAVRAVSTQLHEVERKVDQLGLTSIGRPEYKSDLNSMVEKLTQVHNRVNDIEQRKADKIQRVDVKMRKENGSTE
tara:strand:- start:1559 stop:1909 length:351 start_codon:yes stop_codon:yes gene_type:complete